jgi:hypothetical protein
MGLEGTPQQASEIMQASVGTIDLHSGIRGLADDFLWLVDQQTGDVRLCVFSKGCFAIAIE